MGEACSPTARLFRVRAVGYDRLGACRNGTDITGETELEVLADLLDEAAGLRGLRANGDHHLGDRLATAGIDQAVLSRASGRRIQRVR